MAVPDEKPKTVQPPKDTKEEKVKGKGKDEDKEPELSEEDIALKNNLELMVQRVMESDPGETFRSLLM